VAASRPQGRAKCGEVCVFRPHGPAPSGHASQVPAAVPGRLRGHRQRRHDGRAQAAAAVELFIGKLAPPPPKPPGLRGYWPTLCVASGACRLIVRLEAPRLREALATASDDHPVIATAIVLEDEEAATKLARNSAV
jgi:hypothetical protein